MQFKIDRVKKYIEAAQKRLKATDKEVGENYVNFINESKKTIIGFYFEFNDEVFTLTDLYYNSEFYPLEKNKVFSLKKMMKAVEKEEIRLCEQENIRAKFEEFEDSLA